MVDTGLATERAVRAWRRILERSPAIGLLPILLILLFIFFGLYEPKFWRGANLINVLRNSSYLMIISAGQMLVLVIGGFDLSVGAVVALTSVAAGLVMADLYAAWPDAASLAIVIGLVVGLAVGSAIGVINGVTVAFLRVSPFMVTLGTMSIAFGLALYVTRGVPVYGLPDEFTREFGRLRWFNVPVVVYLTAGIIGVLWWIMNWTRLGRYVYAIGGNIHASRVSGIPTIAYIVITYTMCSFLAAVTGVLLTARVGSGEATLGTTLMLESIAAAVIGGVSLRGGVGRVEFVALGALFLALVTNGMNLLRVDSKIQTIVIGAVLIIAVGLDQMKIKGRGQ